MRDICLRAEVPSVVRAVKRNLYLGTVYYPLLLLHTAGIPLFGRYTVFFTMMMSLLSFIWVALNFISLFSCYRYLCPGKSDPTPPKQQKKRPS
jgi:hypothetical protein